MTRSTANTVVPLVNDDCEKEIHSSNNSGNCPRKKRRRGKPTTTSLPEIAPPPPTTTSAHTITPSSENTTTGSTSVMVVKNQEHPQQHQHPRPVHHKRKRTITTGNTPTNTSTTSTTTHHNSNRTNRTHIRMIPLSPAVMEFSTQLKELVRCQLRGGEKSIDHLLQLYYHPSYDTIRDEHHACIVINACAKGGGGSNSGSSSSGSDDSTTGSIDIAEQVIVHLLASLSSSEQAQSRIVLSSLNIETLTALLKVYVHAGHIQKAWDLFHCHILHPNIRTLNTLLRGCLWSATTTISTLTNTNQRLTLSTTTTMTSEDQVRPTLLLCGGVVTSEMAWQQYRTKQQQLLKFNHTKNQNNYEKKNQSKNHDTRNKANGTVVDATTTTAITILRQSLDTSSYEYSIQLLCQSLQVSIASTRIDEYCTIHNIHFKGTAKIVYINNTNTNHKIRNNDDNDDASSSAAIFESLAVMYLALSRAYAMLIVVLLSSATTTTIAVAEGYSSRNHDAVISNYCTVLWTSCQRCLSSVKLSRIMLLKCQQQLNDEYGENDVTTDATTMNKKGTTKSVAASGGKRGWKANNTLSRSGSNRGNETEQQQSRQRELSNMAYRTHRLSELEMDVLSLLKHCKHNNARSIPDQKETEQQKQHTPLSSDEKMILDIAQQLQSQLLFFSGGTVTSTTTTTTTAVSNMSNDDNDPATQKQKRSSKKSKQAPYKSTEILRTDSIAIRQQLMLASWYSFGLSKIIALMMEQKDMAIEEEKISDCDGTGNIDFDYIRFTTMQSAASTDNESIICDDGMLNTDAIFINNMSSSMKEQQQQQQQQQHPLDIEIGAGFGTWIVEQAQQNQHRNYIAMELRADRCYQIYTRAMLSHSKPIRNLCVIGCDCNILLRERIMPNTVSTFYAHHPEPPTQVLGKNEILLHQIAQGNNNNMTKRSNSSSSVVEPVHMLHSTTILHMCKCLTKDGFIVIVSDNRSYIRLLAATLTKVMREHVNILHTVPLDEIKRGVIHSFDISTRQALRRLESFQSMVDIYEYNITFKATNPTNNNATNGNGTSYFDRLWRTGAGTHSETHTRFVIVMQRGSSRSV